MSEEWRDVPGYEGWYQVSSKGRVRSLGRYVSGLHGSKRWHAGRILGPTTCRGYKVVRLYKRGEGTDYRVHRLVLLAFVGPIPDGHEVNHKDANKGNNALGNLEYATHQENIDHAVKNGLNPIGERMGTTDLTEDEVREIRRLYAQNKRVKNKRYPQRKLAKMFGIGKSTVGSIVRRESWTHI